MNDKITDAEIEAVALCALNAHRAVDGDKPEPNFNGYDAETVEFWKTSVKASVVAYQTLTRDKDLNGAYELVKRAHEWMAANYLNNGYELIKDMTKALQAVLKGEV